MSVSYAKRNHVGLVLLDDGPRRNALSFALVGELMEILAISRRDGMRALVIGSAGKVFCAGADMQEMLEQNWFTWTRPEPGKPTPLDLFEALENDPRPIVAAVDGHAFGGGVELTLACDLVVAGESATFTLPEIGHGVIPNTAVARLPGIVGARAALDLILTRRRVAAPEAHALGLVNRLAPSGTACEAALVLAEGIVSAAPGAIAAVKRGIGRTQDWAAIRALLHTLDAKEWQEGFAAFGEKRQPSFDDRWNEQTTRTGDGGVA